MAVGTWAVKVRGSVVDNHLVLAGDDILPPKKALGTLLFRMAFAIEDNILLPCVLS
jgi:hypothetical protein